MFFRKCYARGKTNKRHVRNWKTDKDERVSNFGVNISLCMNSINNVDFILISHRDVLCKFLFSFSVIEWISIFVPLLVTLEKKFFADCVIFWFRVSLFLLAFTLPWLSTGFIKRKRFGRIVTAKCKQIPNYDLKLGFPSYTYKRKKVRWLLFCFLVL